MNEPAFPCDTSSSIHRHPGMSLRDWFAGMALQGMLASPDTSPIHGSDALARFAYQYADAMLRIRNEESK